MKEITSERLVVKERRKIVLAKLESMEVGD